LKNQLINFGLETMMPDDKQNSGLDFLFGSDDRNCEPVLPEVSPGSFPFVRWYGERGIVNAVVNHLREDPVARTKCLLNAIQWASEPKPTWIDEIQKAVAIVELGLGQFGDPDLILVCFTNSSDPASRIHCVFLEAKIVSYIFSMRSNEQGMKGDHFNSSINGQLALKYRFAKALENVSGKNGKPDVVEESVELFDQYRKILKDSNVAPRHLNKSVIINEVLSPLGLLNLTEKKCHYVALTWDSDNHVFFKDPEVNKKGLPLFLNEQGNDLFDSMCARVGWLGYRALEQVLGLRSDWEYVAAIRTMVKRSEPSEKNYQTTKKRLDDYSQKIVELTKKLAWLFNDAKGCKVVEMKGSYSVIFDNRTLAKVIPITAGVFLGISEERNPQVWFSGELQRYMEHSRPFLGLFIAADVNDLTGAQMFVKGFIEQLE